MRELLFIAVLICKMSTTIAENSYIVSTPSSVRPGNAFPVTVHILQSSDPIDVRVSMIPVGDGNPDNAIISTKSFSQAEPGLILLQKELDASAATWNRHIIRPSGNTSVPSGRPDLMYYTPLLWNAEDHLCNVSIADFNVCSEEALFRSSIPCDEDVYEMCVIIMRRDQSEPPSNFSEAVELYTHLQQDILQML